MSMQLSGSEWQDQKTIALYAINILTCIVLLLCFSLATRFKWKTSHGLEHAQSISYVIATGAMLLYFIIVLVNTGLSETDAIVSDNYYVIYIFGALGWRVGEVLILPIVLGVIHYRFYIGRTATLSFRRGISTTILVVVALITLLSTAAWVLFFVSWITSANDPLYSSDLSVKSINLDIAYVAFYILVAIAAFPPAVILVFRGFSPASTLLPSCILPSLIVRAIMDIIFAIIPTYSIPISYADAVNLELAANFIYAFTNMAIFLGVAVIAMQRPPREFVRKNPRDHGENGASNSVPH